MGRITRRISPRPTVFGRTVKRGGAQTLQDGMWTRIEYHDVTDSADGALIDSRFTCQEAGVYDISVGLVWATYEGKPDPQAGDYLNVAVRKNGSEALKITELTVGVSGPLATTAAGPLRLNAGDFVEVWAFAIPGRTVLGSEGQDFTTFALVKVAG